MTTNDDSTGHVSGQLDLTGEEYAAHIHRLAELQQEQATAEREIRWHRDRAVSRVREARAYADRGEEELDRAVRDARAAGATWQQIGDAAGMARQAAWKRWASPTDHAHEIGAGGRCDYCGATS